ncbi:MAG: serine/threonine-protein kinase, partial [Rhodothermales bacterium]|nr:serine/threonine-protein kinase [Rhodothermales bacterium]
MTPERWRHIQEIFHDALACPAAERAAFLDDACAGDAALRTHVEALLAADAAPAPVLDASLDDLAAGLPFPMPPEAQVGPYLLDGPLGRGGMGVVYRAYDARLDRPVALKFLPPHLSGDARARQRFVAEARAASALDHPHICTIYDVGQAEDGRTYIAMAYYEGQTLKERLAGGPLPAGEAVAVASQVAEALAAAHARGIVHRDVKPGNIFLTEAGAVKLLDFGLAKTAGTDLTRPGTTLGTVAYLSPEQARGEAAGASADLWALGVVLYEMLAGKRPFRGEHAQSILRAVLDDVPPPLPTLRPALPEGLPGLVERALAKHPADRYPDAAALLADLRAVREGAAPAAPPRRASPAMRRRLPYVGLAVLAAVVSLWALLTLWPPPAADSDASAFTALAVLPLDDFSEDPDAAYFADGMTEALIANLAQIEALRVISRTSVMPYRDTERPLPEIARALGVDAVIEGSVTRAGSRVRITVQLIDAATDQHLWAQSYERGLGDVLALQDEVARAIAAEVHAQLTPQEQTRLASARPVDPAAYEAYLRGRYQWNTRTPDGLARALEFYQASLAHDPTYAPAHAGRA